MHVIVTFSSYIVTMMVHVCSRCNNEFGIRCPRHFHFPIVKIIKSDTYYQVDDFIESYAILGSIS